MSWIKYEKSARGTRHGKAPEVRMSRERMWVNRRACDMMGVKRRPFAELYYDPARAAIGIRAYKNNGNGRMKFSKIGDHGASVCLCGFRRKFGVNPIPKTYPVKKEGRMAVVPVMLKREEPRR